jgi:hypothetical protein
MKEYSGKLLQKVCLWREREQTQDLWQHLGAIHLVAWGCGANLMTHKMMSTSVDGDTREDFGDV